jgi:GT2 family glycosyltransferase
MAAARPDPSSAPSRGPRTEPAIDASVVICTCSDERWSDLGRAVSSVARQTVQPLETIVVVDHNPDLARRVQTAWEHVVVVENTRERGVSVSRNVGVAAARGHVIAFLDDDAVAAPTWLATLLQVHESELPLGVGGHVRPHWHDGQPAWFPAEFGWVVGCGYRGLPMHQAAVRNIIGANMSFRKDVLDELGGFDGRLGRVGSVPLGCDETELCVRAHRRWPNGKIIYDPRAVVTHRVSRARSTLRYFVARCYSEGRSKALVRERAGRAGVLSTELAYTLRTLPAGVARGFREARSGDLFGLLRAAAIILGLGVTTAGFAVGRLGRSTSPRHA